jgi:hypothetical protein
MSTPFHLSLVAHGHRSREMTPETVRDALSASLQRLGRISAHLFTATPVILFSFMDTLLEESLQSGHAGDLTQLFGAFLHRWSPAKEGRLILAGRPPVPAPLPPNVLEAGPDLRLGPKDKAVLLFTGYRGRDDILQAVRTAAEEPGSGGTETVLRDRLLTAGLPDPDLVVFTGGLRFIPDFMTYQISYSEIHLAARPWSEFGPSDIGKALDDFQGRDRRYGRV